MSASASPLSLLCQIKQLRGISQVYGFKNRNKLSLTYVLSTCEKSIKPSHIKLNDVHQHGVMASTGTRGSIFLGAIIYVTSLTL